MHQFIYFGDRSKHKANVITVAYVRQEDILQFEYACSRSDDLYNKDEGKCLAVERLSRDPIVIPVVDNVYSTITSHMLSTRKPSLPSWARKLLRQYLVE